MRNASAGPSHKRQWCREHGRHHRLVASRGSADTGSDVEDLRDSPLTQPDMLGRPACVDAQLARAARSCGRALSTICRPSPTPPQICRLGQLYRRRATVDQGGDVPQPRSNGRVGNSTRLGATKLARIGASGAVPVVPPILAVLAMPCPICSVLDMPCPLCARLPEPAASQETPRTLVEIQRHRRTPDFRPELWPVNGGGATRATMPTHASADIARTCARGESASTTSTPGSSEEGDSDTATPSPHCSHCWQDDVDPIGRNTHPRRGPPV